MGTFQVDIEIGDPQGERWEPLRVFVDTGSAYTVVPKRLLGQLGVTPFRHDRFRLANGRVFKRSDRRGSASAVGPPSAWSPSGMQTTDHFLEPTRWKGYCSPSIRLVNDSRRLMH